MDEQRSETTEHAEDDLVERTGVTSVDDVLDRVNRLAERPVAEHVGVFERAHDQLRRALDAQPDS